MGTAFFVLPFKYNAEITYWNIAERTSNVNGKVLVVGHLELV